MKRINNNRFFFIYLLTVILLTAALSLCKGTKAQADSAVPTSASTSEFDNYCSEFVKAYHVPGMAVSVMNEYSVIFMKEYGACTSSSDRFFIGSESKSFTALAIMQLEEKGLLCIDDEITKYLDNSKLASWGVFDSLSPSSEGRPLTIRMLLNQTGGFTQYQRPSERRMTSGYSSYVYANANYDILGEVIESVSGNTYSDYIRENIFKPLGMNDSIADAALAHNSGMLGGFYSFFGLNIPGNGVIPSQNSWFHEPAGYIASTPDDMTKYLQMYLREGVSEDGHRILSEEGIKRMYTETVPQGLTGSSYGFGLMVSIADNRLKVYHNGLTEEYRTYFLFDPTDKIAVSVMINGEDYLVGNQLTQNICNSLYMLATGRSPDKLRSGRFVIRHLTLGVELFAILAIAVVFLLRTLTVPKRIPDSSTIIKEARLRIIGGVFLTICIILLPPLLSSTPLWVIHDYVPDFFLVIVFASVITSIGAISAAVIRIQQSCKAD